MPETIARKLGVLRRAVRAWLWVRGLAQVSVALALFVLLSLLADRCFRMDIPQRVVCLLIGVAALAIVTYRRLMRPLGLPLEDDELCERVESRHTDLRESLISTVQFARRTDWEQLGYSRAMVLATVAQGVQAAGAVDFDAALDREQRNRNLALGAGLVVALAASFALFPGTMGLWFKRNVLLSSDCWPQNTHLTVLGVRDGRLAVPQGDDLEVRVQVSGVIPSSLGMDFQAGRGSGTEEMVRLGEDTFRWTFACVLEPLRLRVQGGDAVSEWIEVLLMKRPTIEELALAVTPPAYVGRGTKALPPGESSYYILKGSTLDLEGRADKPLEQAELFFGKERLAALVVAGERFRLTLPPDKLQTGTYRLAVTDTVGLAGRQPLRFSLKLVPDRAPSVRAKLEGIGDMITPRATIPVSAHLSDDYAVTAAGLAYQASGAEGAAGRAEELPFDALKDRYGAAELDCTYRFEVSALGLAPGPHLAFHVFARDNDALGGPKTGRSGTFAVRLVSEEELRHELLRREQEQRQAFERIIEAQKELVQQTRESAQALGAAGGKDVPDAEWKKLKEAHKQQTMAARSCRMVAEQFAQLLAEVENNKLEEAGGPVRRRMQGGIIAPLRELAQEPIPKAAGLLDQAAASATAPVTRLKVLGAAAAVQEGILAAMRNVLKNMAKWEGYQEAVGLLREVLDAQKDTNGQTIKEQQRRILRIFDQEERK